MGFDGCTLFSKERQNIELKYGSLCVISCPPLDCAGRVPKHRLDSMYVFTLDNEAKLYDRTVYTGKLSCCGNGLLSS